LEEAAAEEGFDADVILVIVGFHHLRAPVQLGDTIACRSWDTKGHGVLRVCH
jgi:acyl-CoA hydrolase